MLLPSWLGTQAAFAATRCHSTGTSRVTAAAGGWALHLLRVEGGPGGGDSDAPWLLGDCFGVSGLCWCWIFLNVNRFLFSSKMYTCEYLLNNETIDEKLANITRICSWFLVLYPCQFVKSQCSKDSPSLDIVHVHNSATSGTSWGI